MRKLLLFIYSDVRRFGFPLFNSQSFESKTETLTIPPNVASIIRFDGVYPYSSVIGVVFARLRYRLKLFLPSYQNEIVYNQHTP